jgi:hypothetical protein
MDKSRELELFEYIYGKYKDWDVISSESPDFVCTRNYAPVLGAETTDLYHSESNARLLKIDGYALELISGGGFRHKDDKKNIRVERCKYLKGGKGPGREINAIIQELPNFAEGVSRLIKTIEDKEQKVDTYLKACPLVDLIINDASRIFWFDKYEHFFFLLSRLANRRVIIESRFREIFLVTAKKENSIVRIPLKISFFAEDVIIFERFIRDSAKPKGSDDRRKSFMVLFCCLSKSGYDNVRVTTPNGCIGIIVGSCLYLYSKDGKVIRDYARLPEQQSGGKLLGDIVKEAGDAEQQKAEQLIKEREQYRCCVSLFSEVENV